MGGNALKHVGVERKQREEYFDIANDVVAKLKNVFGEWIDIIPAFRNKESFGDIDILVVSESIPQDYNELIQRKFSPTEIIHNGDATSFDYRGMQIDLIKAPRREYFFALDYFSYNDLGNLIGRIAHKMGLKFGHDGLWLKVMSADHKIGDVCVTRAFPKALAFLGYSHDRFMQGFDNLDDIFEYAASSPYFHREIFQLENRNHVSRVRDAKRPNYNAFLKWIEEKPELDKHTWVFYKPNERPQEREVEKAEWLTRIIEAFPHVGEEIEKLKKDRETSDQLKKIWNGDIVRKMTSLNGKELGDFLSHCRKIEFLEKGTTFEQYILSLDEVGIRKFVSHMLIEFNLRKIQ